MLPSAPRVRPPLSIKKPPPGWGEHLYGGRPRLGAIFKYTP
jgi:hypothetical protein